MSYYNPQPYFGVQYPRTSMVPQNEQQMMHPGNQVPVPQISMPGMFNTTPQPPEQYHNSTPNSGIIWVQGIEGAKSYMVPPNTSVLLMDSEGTRFYIKSADAAGLPNTRIFEFKEVSANSLSSSPVPSFNPDSFVPRNEFDSLKMEFEQYKSLVGSIAQMNNGGATNESKPTSKSSAKQQP